MSGEQQAARISVDAGRELWRIPPALRGFNFWGTRSDEAFFPEYQKIGLSMLRFPPGRTGDENDLDSQLMNDAGRVAKGLGAELVVEVRLRGGTPERAADNVRYMQSRGYRARFWEVGNEPDLYLPRAGEPQFSPSWYAERFRAFAAAIKAADPSALVFGPVLSNKLADWMPPFIQACGDVTDGLCWHFYGGDGRQSEADLLASTAKFDQQVAQVRGWWADRALNPRGSSRQVPLLISEYGASYQTDVPRNLTTLPAALWTADMLGHLVANRIDMAAYFTLWGINNHGVWDRRGGVRPVHATFRIFREFGSRALAAESGDGLLAPYAALRDDGALTLMVVNKSPSARYRAALDLQGFRASGLPQLLRQADGEPGVAVPYAGPTGAIELDLPPYSATLAIVPGEPGPPAALTWGALAGLAGAAGIAGAAAVIRRRARRVSGKSGHDQKSAVSETEDAGGHAEGSLRTKSLR